MDSEKLGKSCSIAQLGLNILNNPQDICFIKVSNCIAVADDTNGLVILSEKGQLIKHIKECSAASSVCYDEKKNLLIVSICKSISKGDDTPNEICSYDKDFKIVETIMVPREPKISPEYIRWVTVDPDTSDKWVSTGDNKCAVLFKYEQSSNSWKLIMKQDGDLEHPCFINKQQLSIISWDDVEQWKIKILDLNPEKDKVIKTKIVNVTSQTNDIIEPWSLTVGNNGTIYAYDYQSGCIIPFYAPNYKGGDMVANVKAGQFVAIEIKESFIYVSCSDERCVYVFTCRK